MMVRRSDRPASRAASRRRRIVLGLACALAVGLAGWGCRARTETAVPAADSTLTYPAKQPGGMDARITLYKSLSKKTGKMLGQGQTFTMGTKARVRAAVALEGREAFGQRDLMFHLVWMGPGDEEIFTKRVDLAPGDSTTTLESSLSIPPERREPGDYALRVYLFRELIAEKRFAVLTGAEESGAGGEGPTTEEAAAEKKARSRSAE